jgi:hypothetical protein
VPMSIGGRAALARVSSITSGAVAGSLNQFRTVVILKTRDG